MPGAIVPALVWVERTADKALHARVLIEGSVLFQGPVDESWAPFFFDKKKGPARKAWAKVVREQR